MMYFWNRRLNMFVGLILLLAACGNPDPNDPFSDQIVPPGQITPEPEPEPSTPEPFIPQSEIPVPQPDPTIGQTSFVSAASDAIFFAQRNVSSNNNNNQGGTNNGTGGPDEPNPVDERTVEEGDIFQVTNDGKILNLNNYRGFQIIDMADPSDPQIIGRVPTSGRPVEMYQVGDRVYLLLSDSVSEVLVVDISVPSSPQITGRTEIPGYIGTSRLTRGNNKEALYVVAATSGYINVHSFSVTTNGDLQAKSEIGLGGIREIQATSEAFIVVRGNEVSLIDISSEDGVMVEGRSTAHVSGWVLKKSALDLHKGVLRVVSQGRPNYVQTFDASDIHNLKVIDEKTFGLGEDLFATLFLGNKAFFVTFLRADPFHAYEITDSGIITEKLEFIVSGWNDFFKPVAADTRLIGIGRNGSNLAISLYDVSDLTNPNPMVARKEINLPNGVSEASWDERAFTVVEKGTAVLAPDGVTLETGLVLLPFQSRTEAFSAVQIFSFSNTSLTPRGVMRHGDPVRRSFVADQANHTVGNLSAAQLTLQDATNPDAPAQLGSVDLAPDYNDFIVIGGDYGLRRQSREAYYASNGTDSVQIVSLAGNIEDAKTIAEFQVPSAAQLTLVGTTLAVSSPSLSGTTVDLWDLSDPTVPILASTNTYEELALPSYHAAFWEVGFLGRGCLGCEDTFATLSGWGRPYRPIAVGDSLVFPTVRNHADAVDGVTVTIHYAWATVVRCSQITRADGKKEDQICQGFDLCAAPETGDSCDSQNYGPPHHATFWAGRTRRWHQIDLQVLDIRDPAQPGALQTVMMAPDEEALSLLPRGDDLYLSFKKPLRIPDDPRPYATHYMRRISLADPANLIVGPDINIPGELVDVEGATLVTRDLLWGGSVVDPSINILELRDAQAILQDVRRLPDKSLSDVDSVSSSRLLLTERKVDMVYGPADYEQRLNVLDLAAPGIPTLGSALIDNFASLTSTFGDRALFMIPDGLLVMNVADAPFAQAYFPARKWPRSFDVANSTVYFPAGRYGVFTFDLDEFNLLNPAP